MSILPYHYYNLISKKPGSTFGSLFLTTPTLAPLKKFQAV